MQYGSILKQEAKEQKIVKNNEVLVQTRKYNGLYKVNSNEMSTYNSVNRKDPCAKELWHKKFGHFITNSLLKLNFFNKTKLIYMKSDVLFVLEENKFVINF